MGKGFSWCKFFLILVVLIVTAFGEGYYVGGSFGIAWLVATHVATVSSAVVLMRKHAIGLNRKRSS
jgi:hypothetical protein